MAKTTAMEQHLRHRIEELETELALARRACTSANAMVDKLRDEAVNVPNADERQLKAVAACLPDGREANCSDWGDICHEMRVVAAYLEDFEQGSRRIAKLVDCDTGCTIEEVAEAVDDKLRELTEKAEELDELPVDWEEWVEFVRSTPYSPDQIERMAELLESMAPSEFALRHALASENPQATLKLYS